MPEEQIRYVTLGVDVQATRITSINPIAQNDEEFALIENAVKCCLQHNDQDAHIHMMEDDMDEFLTTKELSARIKLTPSTIRNMVCRGDFKPGVHFVRAGRRKLLFLWTGIAQWLHGRGPADKIPN